MFTDLVGFTAAAQSDEERTLATLREEERLVRPVVAEHHGVEIKSTGDGSLVEFESALQALRCAIAVQRVLQDRNARGSGPPIQLRIGLHVGDVEARDDDIFGDAVNVAARIVTRAEPGGICLSAQVFDHVRRKIPEAIEPIGPSALKGVQEPLELYRVVLFAAPDPTVAAGPAVPRLAVLPLANISPDPKDEYFADGLTEELIAVLSRIRGLRVIARTSIAQYKGTTKTIPQIGRELSVQSVLEGSVRKSGERLRITLQLIDVGTQEHAWSETYTRQMDDVFEIQSEIAERTARALRVELKVEERAAIQQPATRDVVAYEQFLRGRLAWQSTDYGSFDAAIGLLESATERDPAFAAAHAALTNLLVTVAGESRSSNDSFPPARRHVEAALRLAPHLADAHAAAGTLAMQADRDWALAERELKQAIALNPSHAAAWGWYGILLDTLQRFDESIRSIERAIELDPNWPILRIRLVTATYRSGDGPMAVERATGLVATAPERPDYHRGLAYSLWTDGRRTEARAEAKLGAQLAARGVEASRRPQLEYAHRLYREAHAVLEALSGDPGPAEELLATLEAAAGRGYVPRSRRALLQAALGRTDAAIDLLERDSDGSGDNAIWFSYQEIGFDPIRQDPRFQALLRASHLPTGIQRALDARSGGGSPPPTHPSARSGPGR